MKKQEVIIKTRDFVEKTLETAETGHDFFHIERVVRNAKKIAQKEGGNKFVIELGALLHDVADWKFHGGDDTVGTKKTRQWLSSLGIDKKIIEEIAYVVDNISFKGGTNKNKMKTIEGKIVQDADRLDALGGIGIGRAFAYGGHDGRPMHNPKVTPKKYKSFEEYKRSITEGRQSTVNHFYEKLLLLKDIMNTKTGKKMADKRHKYMENFLKKFHAEWDGKE